MNQRNALIFFGIFGLLFILVMIIGFFSGSDEEKKPPLLPPEEATSTGTAPFLPQSGFAEPLDGENPYAPNSLGATQSQGNETPPVTETGVVQNPLGNETPFKGKLTLGTLSLSYDPMIPNEEYIMIQADYENTTKVLLSGMTLKSLPTGNSATIGNGVYLPYSGVINPTEPIYLSAGETAVISTGKSPVGYSFRINKCFGYMSQFQNFNPWIPPNCPLLRYEPLPKPPNALEDACLDYIDSYPSCRYQTRDRDYLSAACNNFIREKGNYTYCVNAHKNDSNFYRPEWRIYLGRNQTLWKSSRETIVLLDQNGKTIDSYTY